MNYVDRIIDGACDCGYAGLNARVASAAAYRDAGWHFALHLEPLMMAPSEDEKLHELHELLEGEASRSNVRAVERWLDREFHELIATIPVYHREDFARGVIDAALLYGVALRASELLTS